jgi:uncharacterized protein
MKVVLDTNILLVSISRKSPHHWVFQNLINGVYRLCVTTDILSEYSEKIEEHMGREVSEATLHALMELPNVEKIETYFKWDLIKDADDNKFCDCMVAAGADYLVTQDKDFNILSKIPFPRIKIIGLLDFKSKLK